MFEVGIIAVLILANGVFSMAEFAVVSARRTKLQHRADQGDQGALAALILGQSPTRFLSTVQIGITLIGILSGAFGGARIAEDISPALAGLPYVGAYNEEIAFAVVVAVIVFASLIIGELVPKQLALSHPETIASALSRPMMLVAKLFAPVAAVLSVTTHLALRILGIKQNPEPGITEEEIKSLISHGRRTGAVQDTEAYMLLRVFRAGGRHVGDIMTRRSKIVWIDRRMTVAEFLMFNSHQYFSHFPVCDGSVDNMVGMLSVKEFVKASGQGVIDPAGPIERYAHPAYFVPETKEVLELLHEMRQNGMSTGVVVDEFGGIAGMVTYKQLVGEIVGQSRQEGAEETVRPVSDTEFQIDGSMRIDELNEMLNLEIPDGEYETVAGFVMSELGSIPSKGDRLSYGALTFVVSQTRGPRIEKVTVKKPDSARAA